MRKQPFKEFVQETLLPSFIYGALIPSIFIFLSILKLTILPSFVSDRLSAPLSLVWPVLYDNYIILKSFNHITDAINYVTFVFMMLIFSLISVYNFISKFVERRKRIESLSVKVHIAVSFGIIFVIALATSDRVVFEFKSLGYFYVDSFGLYFIREYMMFLGVLAYVVLLFVTLSTIFDLVREKIRE